MAQRVYATAADYTAYAEEPFDGDDAKLVKRLRRASGVIDGLTRFARYDLDEDGFPTDPDVSKAFTEATCAQVEYWETTDDPTGAESTMGPVRIGSVSLGGSGVGGSAQNHNSASDSRVSPEAYEILANEGLVAQIVGSR
ncbi:hypothetical protein IT072_03660 [Leifsonia sp. ZF2019]|uniref:hypothetical protein n=1 Tax=Leifsonia sp. ZF2019 TaxID=2781978 RepID=UPI001CBB4E93|nr:hypothetical protein [Leifsonia sp. ZF2019]UAJ80155.1 hypothetical protein IT072_03660 [Leifsonia sp. ZF2019]